MLDVAKENRLELQVKIFQRENMELKKQNEVLRKRLAQSENQLEKMNKDCLLLAEENKELRQKLAEMEDANKQLIDLMDVDETHVSTAPIYLPPAASGNSMRKFPLLPKMHNPYSNWTAEELMRALRGFVDFGMNYNKIAELIGPTRPREVMIDKLRCLYRKKMMIIDKLLEIRRLAANGKRVGVVSVRIRV